MSHSLPPSPYAISASTSTFSLILDPIAENAPSLSPIPLSASPVSETVNPPPFTRPSQPRHGRRPPHIGLGQPSKPNSLRSAFSSSFPQSNAELILYSYAQLAGTVIITPLPGISSTPAQIETLRAVRSSLFRRSAVGGGSMDITSSLHQPPQQQRRPSHSRSSSLSAGLRSLLSPSSLVASVSSPPATPSSAFSGLLSPSQPVSGNNDKVGLGIYVQEEINSETPLPTFEVQPAMLAVDLCLLPGESRSCAWYFLIFSALLSPLITL
jgi:RAB6A-GEF complex partner protein 2